MQSKPKSNSVITHTYADGTLTFHVRGAGDLKLRLSQVSAAVKERAMLHGFIQRVSDAAALSRNPANGAVAAPADKAAAMQRLVDHYESGTDDWSPARVAGERKAQLDAIILAAVGEATGREESEIREMVAKGSGAKGVTEAAYLAALGTSSKVAPILERMREEQASRAGVDGDDELDALMGD